MQTNKVLTNGELQELEAEIAEISKRLDILDGSSPIEAAQIDALDYRLAVIEQTLEASLKNAVRSKFSVLQGENTPKAKRGCPKTFSLTVINGNCE